ncbi:hypothetical protein C8R43DRAFT_986758, partial [Mycena crocata]
MDTLRNMGAGGASSFSPPFTLDWASFNSQPIIGWNTSMRPPNQPVPDALDANGPTVPTSFNFGDPNPFSVQPPIELGLNAFLSRKPLYQTTPRPRAPTPDSRQPTAGSSESDEQDAPPDPVCTEATALRTDTAAAPPDRYHVLLDPPYLVKYVQELPQEPVVGSLCVREWGGRAHVVEVVAPWSLPHNPNQSSGEDLGSTYTD